MAETSELRTGEEGNLFLQFLLPLMAGGIAGTTVDVVLFPLDTIKTRLQSKNGFWRAGGFHRIYAGILPAAAGSAPSAATFFCTYEFVKFTLGYYFGAQNSPFTNMIAASLGEVTSCIVRVPFEVVKQRAQAHKELKPYQILRQTISSEGPFGLYRGYFSIVLREIPFSFIQYPTWEFLKKRWSDYQEKTIEPWQGAVCGAVAGGLAAAITTPLDVVKTRIMLAHTGSEEIQISIYRLLLHIGKVEGIKGLFAGFLPRVSWISLGGFVFLGAYEKSKHLLFQWYNG